MNNVDFHETYHYDDGSFIPDIREEFDELLECEISRDIELCNSDLSECIKTKAIVQNVTNNDVDASICRQVLLPVGSCKAGMYIRYQDKYWIIINAVDENGMFEKAIVYLCNIYLSWVNAEKQIIQRWACVMDASKVQSGEYEIRFFSENQDKLSIILPDDDECIMLYGTSKRFIIDRRCKLYERQMSKGIEWKGTNPLSVYSINRDNTVVSDYQDSGYCSLIATHEEKDTDDGYYIVNGVGYWLCEKPQAKNDTELFSEIICDEPVVYVGAGETIFRPAFYDSESTKVVIPATWNVDCDFSDKLNIRYDNDDICISTDDRSVMNKTFTLTLSGEGYNDVPLSVSVIAF